MKDDRVLAETAYLQFVDRDGWSFVRRANEVGVVTIAAADPEGKMILVEQFRPPVNTTVIELPAGLAGDAAGEEDEPLWRAAERELLEETGYQAEKWNRIVDLSSSAGLTSEVVTLFHAEKLTRVAAGGGVDNEEITVHHVLLSEVGEWLLKKQSEGKLIDGRVYTGLFILLNSSASS